VQAVNLPPNACDVFPTLTTRVFFGRPEQSKDKARESAASFAIKYISGLGLWQTAPKGGSPKSPSTAAAKSQRWAQPKKCSGEDAKYSKSDAKSIINEFCQKNFGPTPSFDTNPLSSMTQIGFRSMLTLPFSAEFDNDQFSGSGKSKGEAENEAAIQVRLPFFFSSFSRILITGDLSRHAWSFRDWVC
jgi:hypothetical protein